MANIIEDIYRFEFQTSEAQKELLALIQKVEQHTEAAKKAKKGTEEYKAAQTTLSQSMRELGGYMSANGNTIEALRAKVETLRGALDKAKIGSNEFKSVQQEIITTQQRLAAATVQSSSALQGNAGGFFSVGNVAKFAIGGAVAIGAALAGLATKAISAASQVADFRVALETMLDSKAKAAKVEAEITAIAAKSPFNLAQVQDLTKQLVAYGFTAKEIAPTVTQLGNISAGVGKEKLPQLTLALGQVRAAGKLTGQELRQFTEAGVPLLELLGNQSGKTAGQIKADMERGAAPSFKEVQTAIAAAASEGGKFGGLMEKMSENTSGLWSNLQDSVFQLAAAFGERLAPYANTALKAMGGLVSSLQDFVGVSDVEKLQEEQAEYNALTGAILSAAEGTEIRTSLISEMQTKYPLLFASLDKEIDLNSALKKTLDDVNKSYRLRIDAAAAAEIAEEERDKATLKRKQAQKFRTELNEELGIDPKELEQFAGKDEALLKQFYIQRAEKLGKIRRSLLTGETPTAQVARAAKATESQNSTTFFDGFTIADRIAKATQSGDKQILKAIKAESEAVKTQKKADENDLQKLNKDIADKEALLKSKTFKESESTLINDIKTLKDRRNELLGIDDVKVEKPYDKAAEEAKKAAKKRLDDLNKTIKDAVDDLQKILNDAIRDIAKQADKAELEVSGQYSNEAKRNIESVQQRFEALVKSNEQAQERAVRALRSGSFNGESLKTTDDKGRTFTDPAKVRDAANKIKDEFKNYVTDQKSAASESIKQLSSFFAEAAKVDEKITEAEIAAIQDANARKVAEIERAYQKKSKTYATANASILDLLKKGLIDESQANREIAKNNELQAADELKRKQDIHDEYLKEIEAYYKTREQITKNTAKDESTIVDFQQAVITQVYKERYIKGEIDKVAFEEKMKNIDSLYKREQIDREIRQYREQIELEKQKAKELQAEIERRKNEGGDTAEAEDKLGEATRKVGELETAVESAKAKGLDFDIKVKDEALEKTKQKVLEITGYFKTISDSVLGAISKVASAQEAAIDEAISRSEKRLQDLLSDQKNTNAKQVEIEREKLEKLGAERRKAAERQKEIAVIQVVSSSLVAIANAAASGFGFASILTIGAVLASLGAGLAAARAGAENAFFDGTDFVPLGNNKKGRDTIPARLHEGEAVIQADKNADYHPTVKAVRRGTVPANVLNNFVKQYQNGIDYSSIHKSYGIIIRDDSATRGEIALLRQDLAQLTEAVRNQPSTNVNVGVSAKQVFEITETKRYAYNQTKKIAKL